MQKIIYFYLIFMWFVFSFELIFNSASAYDIILFFTDTIFLELFALDIYKEKVGKTNFYNI